MWRIEVRRVFPKPVARRVGYGLNTVNLGRFYAGIFDSIPLAGIRSVSLVDVNGAVVSPVQVKQGTRLYNTNVNQPAGLWGISVGTSVNDDLRVLARLGTGSNTPNRSQSNLQTPVAGDIQLASTYNDGDVVSLTGTGNYGLPFSPSEVGVFMEGGGGTTNVKRTYMIDRTVFSPLPSGTVFTVRVDIPLG
jgi:hypothetical protein